MADFGVSFVPGQDGNTNQQPPGGSAPGGPPIQQALQMLSLRLPRVVGANALAPQGLLQGQGGGGMPNLEQLLLKLFGPGGILANGGSSPGDAPGGQSPSDLPGNFPSSLPTTHFTPGGGSTAPQLPTPAPGLPTWPGPQPVPGGGTFPSQPPPGPNGPGRQGPPLDRSGAPGGGGGGDVFQRGPWGLRGGSY